MERRVLSGNYVQYYTEGSTVRKQYVEPEYEEPEYEEPQYVISSAAPEYELPEEGEIPSYAKVTKRKPQKGLRLAMSPVFAVFLGGAVLAVLAICCKVLSMQSLVTNQSDEITILQAQVEQLAEDNDAYEIRINNSVDLEAIRDAAVNRLGMVYPTEGQVVYYDLVQADYVRQYQDVPSME